ncbi:MAG: GIY-YIG nuclease family protein [Thermomonas haemolytica]
MKQPAVYMLATGRRGTLYVGVTSNLIARIWQHREHAVDGFTKRYGIDILVWYELHDSMEAAIQREKRLKRWNREWKLRLVEEANPEWWDLWPAILGQDEASTGGMGQERFPPARE